MDNFKRQKKIAFMADLCASHYEQKFLDIVLDYELHSLVRNIQQQVWVANRRYRVDFLFVIDGHPGIIVEIDGSQHIKNWTVRKRDRIRDYILTSFGYEIVHMPYWRLKDSEYVAGYIESVIHNLTT